MAINFPDNPTNGQQYTVNNITYTYDSTNNRWTAIKQLNLDEVNLENVIAYSTVLGGW